MFFYLSKLLGIFLFPITLFLFAFALCLIAYWIGFQKSARFSGLLLVLLFFLSAYTQFPDFLLTKLETTLDQSVLEKHRDDLAGIIVLGGALKINKQKKRDWYHTNAAAERIIEGVYLARKFPEMPILYSGGNGSIFNDGSIEADGFTRVTRRLGGLKNPVYLEKKSRNTRQNAAYSVAIIRNEPKLDAKGYWLLVTSAFHMKRSLAAFKKEGLKVVAWPTDFRADLLRFPFLTNHPNTQLKKLKIFIHEIIGLAIYALIGKHKSAA